MQNLQIIKKEQSFNTILFVALAPNEVDRNGDFMNEFEITKTAHEFMENLQVKTVDIDHNSENVVENAKFVESFIAPADFLLENGNIIPKGSWIVGIKFEEEIFKKFENGDFVGISIYGFGKYEE